MTDRLKSDVVRLFSPEGIARVLRRERKRQARNTRRSLRKKSSADWRSK